MRVNLRARYEHDCSRCALVGTVLFPAPHRLEGRSWTEPCAADLYCCGSEGDGEMGPSILARTSSKPSDYASAPASIIRDNYMKAEQSTMGPALVAGYWFAVAAGLVKHEEQGR